MSKRSLQLLAGLCILAGLAGLPAHATRAAVTTGTASGDLTDPPVALDPMARPAAFDPVPDSQEDGVLWFPATGHTLRHGFRAFWEQNGGLAQFGYPLSEEFSELLPGDQSPYVVQYFQRNRFEWHPENAGSPSEFELGLLGRDATAGAAFPPSPPFGSSLTHLYFPATQHSLEGAFLDYWQNHGGLPVFGYPISEEVLEQAASDGRVYLMQYFERNRFELHPEHRGTPDEVQLGLLSVDLLRARGWIK